MDSEVLMGQLKANDFDVHHEKSGNDCNIVIINTCGFIENAKEESINTILEYAEAKQKGKLEKLFVTGCLSQRYRDDLEKEIPQVDSFFGTLELPQLLAKLNANYKHELIGERLLTTPMHYAYLKISEGCNRTCAFCAIPLMRGRHISKPKEAIITEAKNLVRNGVKEIILIAQELTYYGLDIYKKRMLADLLKELSELKGVEWIRLHYAYPHNFPIEILEVINEKENICKYIDFPLQHISDNVLKGMRRQITKNETIELVKSIREKIPTISLRTTMLVGFPNETEKEFEELSEFIRETKFDRLGIFTYSHEEGTSAFQLEDNIPQKVKEERAAQLMEIQEQISFEKNQQRIGKEFKVLFDRKEGDFFIGRTEFDSPEVDNEVLVNAAKNHVRIGDFAKVKITDAKEFDLYGEIIS